MPRCDVIGIDVGATRIKGGVVDTLNGRVCAVRREVPTPYPATPMAVARTVAAMVEHWSCPGSVGITLPCTVRNGVAESAVNIDPAWVGIDASHLMSGVLGGRPVVVTNDADAAAVAEARHGAARGHRGAVLVLTFGTGIGSALLLGGELEPHTEFGQLRVDGHVAEQLASAAVRRAHRLPWPEWCARVSRLVASVEERTMIHPDLVVIGGGVSRAVDRWRKLLPSNVVPAALRNSAGLIGAAVLAADAPADDGVDDVAARAERVLAQVG